MRLRRRPDHVEVLARTAQLEMEMGVGSYRDTLAQMHDLVGQLDRTRNEHRSAEDLLIGQLRQQLANLEFVVSRREDEYDRLQEKYCKLRELVAKELDGLSSN